MRILLICLLIVFVGCCGGSSGDISKKDPPVKTQEFRKNIVKVFMHEAGNYTVMIKQEDNSLVEESYVRCDRKIIADVPKFEPMFVEGWLEDNWKRVVNIHIHSADDVNGAGWNHGKHGKGQTEVVE